MSTSTLIAKCNGYGCNIKDNCARYSTCIPKDNFFCRWVMPEYNEKNNKCVNLWRVV
jgi:hypothetical protein